MARRLGLIRQDIWKAAQAASLRGARLWARVWIVNIWVYFPLFVEKKFI